MASEAFSIGFVVSSKRGCSHTVHQARAGIPPSRNQKKASLVHFSVCCLKMIYESLFNRSSCTYTIPLTSRNTNGHFLDESRLRNVPNWLLGLCKRRNQNKSQSYIARRLGTKLKLVTMRMPLFRHHSFGSHEMPKITTFRISLHLPINFNNNKYPKQQQKHTSSVDECRRANSETKQKTRWCGAARRGIWNLRSFFWASFPFFLKARRRNILFPSF